MPKMVGWVGRGEGEGEGEEVVNGTGTLRDDGRRVVVVMVGCGDDDRKYEYRSEGLILLRDLKRRIVKDYLRTLIDSTNCVDLTLDC